MDRQNENQNSAEQDERFDQLLALAREGDEASIHGLWTEFGFDIRSGRFSEGRKGLDLGDRTDLEDDGQNREVVR